MKMTRAETASTDGGAEAPVRVGLLADIFASGSDIFEGDGEQHLFRLAEAMGEAGIEATVYQPGDPAGDRRVNGIEIRCRPVRSRYLWCDLARRALAKGRSHLYFK